MTTDELKSAAERSAKRIYKEPMRMDRMAQITEIIMSELAATDTAEPTQPAEKSLGEIVYRLLFADEGGAGRSAEWNNKCHEIAAAVEAEVLKRHGIDNDSWPDIQQRLEWQQKAERERDEWENKFHGAMELASDSVKACERILNSKWSGWPTSPYDLDLLEKEFAAARAQATDDAEPMTFKAGQHQPINVRLINACDDLAKQCNDETWHAFFAAIKEARAEMVERALPVTEEWLREIGGEWSLQWAKTIRLPPVRIDFSNIEFPSVNGGNPEVIVDPGLASIRHWKVDHAKTRGDVLDLLTALGVKQLIR